VLKSAKRDGNKQIADFNLRKSAAIFANDLRKGRKYTQQRGHSRTRNAHPYNKMSKKSMSFTKI
jgi:hypothetical protein